MLLSHGDSAMARVYVRVTAGRIVLSRVAGYADSKAWLLANKVMWWRRLHKPDVNLRTTFCGDSVRYGWEVIAGSLTKEALVYSFGIGTNASFEEQALRDFGCQIYAFDPTPKSINYVRSQNFGPRFHFREIGIWDVDGEVEFAGPANPADVSCTAILQDTNLPTFRARVGTLTSIMGELGHTKIHVLKMDVEGSEYRIIENLARGGVRPRQLLVEFHQGFYGCTAKMTRDSVKTLRDIGYDIFWVSSRGLEYGFVYRDCS
jgi:FkbM family methyltransferase